MKDLRGKVALITGAASGIGRGLVDAMAAAGMTVMATDIDAVHLEDVNAALRATGAHGGIATLDIRDRAAWTALLERTEREFGPVQLLCNNAGVTATPQPCLDLAAEAWDWVLGINLTGAFNGACAVAQRLRTLGLPGHIVNTASVQGLFAASGFAPYNAAKFGIVGLSETLRIELEPLEIGVSVLCPGPTRTRIMANSARIAPHLARPIGAARAGMTNYQTPAEVAAKVLDAIRANRLYILTHDEYAAVIEARAAALASSFGRATAAAIDNVRSVEAGVLRMYEAATQPPTPSGDAA